MSLTPFKKTGDETHARQAFQTHGHILGFELQGVADPARLLSRHRGGAGTQEGIEDQCRPGGWS